MGMHNADDDDDVRVGVDVRKRVSAKEDRGFLRQ